MVEPARGVNPHRYSLQESLRRASLSTNGKVPAQEEALWHHLLASKSIGSLIIASTSNDSFTLVVSPHTLSAVIVVTGCVWAVLIWPCLLTVSLPLDCKDEQGSSISRCPSISQEKLLDRVIQHAELIYRVSEESCSLFEEMFVPFPMRFSRNQAGYACITKALPIPSSKSEIQQISDKWLLHSVLMLVQSWIEPLVYLQTALDRYDDAPDMLLNKTKWVSEKLISLEQGVMVLIRKMLGEGMLTTTYSERGLAQYDVQPAMLESVQRDYTLLSCFKKDAHKMETFLKLLKCRQTDKYNCALY
ncbi:somatolactin alpha [Diretmus argenteus]